MRRSVPLRIPVFGILAALTAGLLIPGCAIEPDIPVGYAIVYGVSEYESINDLGQPDDDAQAVAALLEADGYEIISGGPRLNTDAHSANLRADFAEVAATAAPDSRFFFYFAGHGYGDGMEDTYGNPPFSQEWAHYLETLDPQDEPLGAGVSTEFLFLYAADPFNDVELTLEESVSDDRLARLLKTVPSAQQIVVIDACHSGGFIGSGTAVDTVPRGYDGYHEGLSALDALNAATLYLDGGSNGASDIPERQAIVIAAAGEQEFSYEGQPGFGLPNGVFTHYFLESRELGDRNYDGFVTASEAYSWAASAIATRENDKLAGDAKFYPRLSGGAVDPILFRAR